MIQKHQRLFNALNRILDGLLLMAALALSSYLWLAVIRRDTWNIAGDLLDNLSLLAGYAAVMVLVYQIAGLYDSLRARLVRRDVLRVLVANAVGVLGVAAFLFVLRLEDFSRGVLGVFYLLSSAFIIGKRLLTRALLNYVRGRGYNQKHVILVGCGRLAEQYARSVREHPKFGFTIDGYLGLRPMEAPLRCFGTVERLPELLQNPGIDEVVAALEPEDVALLPAVIAAEEKQGVKVSILPFYNDYMPASARIEVVGEAKLINLRTTPLDDPLNAAVKRLMDILCALVLIALSSPLMLVAAVGTRLSSPGPVIFRQTRVGKDRRLFTMYKFRSMRINAREATGWTTDDDPRKTRFGSFLRKTSMDELPQFFNVLKGDMSIVGPRPEVPHFVEQFRETIPLYMLKHRVRPGITGWAQVKGFRGDTSIEGRIRCDLYYIENWSLWLDIRILFLTAFGGMVNKEKLT